MLTANIRRLPASLVLPQNADNLLLRELPQLDLFALSEGRSLVPDG